MTEDEDRLAAQKMREQMEADLVKNRIEELREQPIQGDFDAAHLKAVHAYIFQDLPHHRPGITRDDTAESWIKHRALEGRAGFYDVPYVSQDIDAKLSEILQEFGGAGALKGLQPNEAALKLAQVYGALDHAHGFYEGNSRTLREFTRELASEAGFDLDWTGTGVGSRERNALYVARDIAVLESAYPGLTPEKMDTTNDRAEYEAAFLLQKLQRAAGEKTLDAIIRDGLTPTRQHDRQQDNHRPMTGDQIPSRDFDPVRSTVLDDVTKRSKTPAERWIDHVRAERDPNATREPDKRDRVSEHARDEKTRSGRDDDRGGRGR